MSGNVPNISRDSFSYGKFYDKLVLQQGVPIPDSDWNEMNDVLRMAEILVDEYFIGSMRRDDGFQIVEASSPSNNFEITGGWAMVLGVIVPTSPSEPPDDYDYTQSSYIYSNEDYNYICKGVVTDTDGPSNTIEDSEKKWESFHNLVNCRVYMASGPEAGNFFDITGYDATNLELSGGIGSIGVGNQYIVVPPALTTPGGARTDRVYIMVWWDDISDAEDSSIQHPGLGVETCHRSKRHWCVRVAENASTPSTPSIHSFGVRYLQIATLSRTATANITSSMISNESNGDSLANHIASANPHGTIASQIGFTAHDYVTSTNVQAAVNELIDDLQAGTGSEIGVVASLDATTLSNLNGGGLGTLTNLQAAMGVINAQVIRRRAFTAVFTDGTLSDNGDIVDPTAIESVASFTGGTFMLRRGNYVMSGLSITAVNDKVIGEIKGANQTITLDQSSNITLRGSWERIWFNSDQAAYQFQLQDGVRLVDCAFDSGTFILVGDEIYWSGGGIYGQSATPTANQAFLINDTHANPYGLIENCSFEGPGTGAASPDSCVKIDGVVGALGLTRKLTFRNCTFNGLDGVPALYITGCTDAELVFEDCRFETTSETLYCLRIASSYRFTFRNCTFYGIKGRVAHVHGAGIFENCRFICGTTSPTVEDQMATFEPYGGRIVVRDCLFYVESPAIDPATGAEPVIEFGGRSETPISANKLTLDNVLVRFVTGLHKDHGVLVHGPGTSGDVVINGIEVDTNSQEIASDRGSGHAHLAFRSQSTEDRAFTISNVRVSNIDNPATSITDTGSIIRFDGPMTVNNVWVSQAPTISGAGDFRPVNGFVFVEDKAQVYGLYLWMPDIDISTAAAFAAILLVQNEGQVYGGKIQAMLGGSSSGYAISVDGTLSGLRVEGTFSTTFPLLFAGTGLISNNVFILGGTDRPDPDITGSAEVVFVGNKYEATFAGASQDAYYNTAVRNICDGNSFITASNAPTITVSGTGSVSGDNVVALG